MLVSVSRHLYITADRRVLYQRKPFGLSLEKAGQSRKNHLVHYLIRDHFSGHFYAEASESKDLISAGAFVYRAWSVKEEHSFRGVPETLSVPATVARVFKNLPEFVQGWGVHVIEPPSGFEAGVRDLRTWEDQVVFDATFGEHSFEQIQQLALLRSYLLSTDKNDKTGTSKLARWSAGFRGPLRIPAPPE
jgi:hypothetical protein